MVLFGTQEINSQGHLVIGGCDVLDLVGQFGTPLYVMDEELIRRNCREYLAGFRSRYPNTDIAFAGKAFLNMAMCRLLHQEGLYLDVASAGEIHTALLAGFPADRLFFHGNNKSEEELQMALEKGIGRIVVDNLRELDLLNRLVTEEGRKADILLRLTPGIDPHTHRLIRTGQADTKFGLNIKDGSAMEAVRQALSMPGIALRGFHCHVGSQLLDTDAHRAAVRIMIEFTKEVLDRTGFAADEINTGGGLGIRYVEAQKPPTIDEFAADITDTFLKTLNEVGLNHEPRLIQEPGRSIVGPAGTTLYTVGTIKTVPITDSPGYRTYVAIDGGMSDNPRPALYDAVYEAFLANKMKEEPTNVVTISGKHCETDTLIQSIQVPDVVPGDILA
ncbi:MAG: diaminopimelate decarboxylase, partial [Armatimonadetes bacterium]|nr:diaminopimelate decarboxylase [Armatimonadota bacterium]